MILQLMQIVQYYNIFSNVHNVFDYLNGKSFEYP